MLKGATGIYIITSLILLYSQFWTSNAYVKVNHRLIKIINSLNISWQAGENPTNIPANFSRRALRKRRIIITPRSSLKQVKMPKKLDTRRHFNYCKQVIDRIRNQGDCGNCWAVAAASVATDRTCIELKEPKNHYNIHLSSEDLATCCEKCRGSDSCWGGDETEALKYWVDVGIVSGGEVGTQEGCKPYSKELSNSKYVRCKKKCTNKNYPNRYQDDKRRGGMVYVVDPSENEIQLEIYNNGPVLATMQLYEDFQIYRKGVYRHLLGDYHGLHVVKIIGWGVAKQEKYWLIVNSYGEHWGEKGIVKFLRGENHCHIEQEVVAAKLHKYQSPRSARAHAHDLNVELQRWGIRYFMFFVLITLSLNDSRI